MRDASGLPFALGDLLHSKIVRHRTDATAGAVDIVAYLNKRPWKCPLFGISPEAGSPILTQLTEERVLGLRDGHCRLRTKQA
jgi:hypothetical protein